MARRPSTVPRATARGIAKLTALQYQLRIELRYIEPTIWRRVLVPENLTLAKLHSVLQVTMGWCGGHLHEYQVGRLLYGIPDEDWPSAEPLMDERKVRLHTLVESGARKLTYRYDFGDDWEHLIKVEDLVMPKTAGKYRLLCVDGDNACPPRVASLVETDFFSG